MRIWEVHKNLSEAVGDSADIDSANLYDGVRYSRSERDLYIYQALIKVFNKMLGRATMLPKKEMNMFIERMFPNHIKHTIIDYNADVDLNTYGITLERTDDFDIAVPINLYAMSAVENDFSYRGYPIPFKYLSQINKLINSRVGFKPDTFFTYSRLDQDTSIITVYDYQSELETISGTLLEGLKLRLDYLNYPKNPATQEPTDFLDIETKYIDMVVNTAMILMYRADQEIEGFERIMSLIEPVMPAGGR